VRQRDATGELELCRDEPELRRGIEIATGRIGPATDGPTLRRGELELRRDELELQRTDQVNPIYFFYFSIDPRAIFSNNGIKALLWIYFILLYIVIINVLYVFLFLFLGGPSYYCRSFWNRETVKIKLYIFLLDVA